MNVSPAGGGNINVAGQGIPSKYPASFTCSTTYQLTAVPNTTANYKFDRWGGSVSGSANPVSVSVSDGAKTVTAYFVKKTNPVTLQDAKNLTDGSKDVLIIDVSSASDYAASHMLCAKNYIWNSASNSFSTSITNLSAFKDTDILIYDQTGAQSSAAAGYLAEQGFNSISYMTDALDPDWIAEGYETFTTAEDGGKCTSLAPTAYAGADQTMNENQKVTLSGSGSSVGVMHEWEQEEGGSVVLSSLTAPNPTFTAPDLNGPAATDVLVFHLTVTDSGGKKDTDSVTVTVRWNNGAPTANAGPDQTVKYGDTVQLDGSASNDPENNISYQWTVTGSQINPAPILTNPKTANPSFTAPSTPGWVIYELTVTDNGGLTDSDTVKVTVQAGTPPVNQPPAANAGPDQTVTEGATVTLDGSGSADSDGTIASREWTQTAGSPIVTLSGTSAVKPTFTAPSVDAATDLTFTLTVTDDDGATGTDTVKITVNDDGVLPPNQSPTADAGKDQSVKEGTTVVLDGSASSDPDGTIAGYAWTQTDTTGIPVTLSGATTAKPTFAAPAVDDATTFTFTLTVTDDKGLTSSANAVSITVTKAGGGGGGGGCFISSMTD